MRLREASLLSPMLRLASPFIRGVIIAFVSKREIASEAAERPAHCQAAPPRRRRRRRLAALRCHWLRPLPRTQPALRHDPCFLALQWAWDWAPGCQTQRCQGRMDPRMAAATTTTPLASTAAAPAPRWRATQTRLCGRCWMPGALRSPLAPLAASRCRHWAHGGGRCAGTQASETPAVHLSSSALSQAHAQAEAQRALRLNLLPSHLSLPRC